MYFFSMKFYEKILRENLKYFSFFRNLFFFIFFSKSCFLYAVNVIQLTIHPI
jgi:hypothetical protein